jgi:hypothetical protein
MLPETIEEVIIQLDQIIANSIRDKSRLGYFAALYKRVTLVVRDKINEGYFQDNPRMERLDVIFANRYLDAYYRYQEKQSVTVSWQLAFDAATSWKSLVLQHLLLGMNAHISLDLGIAAATVSPGVSIHSLHEDFNRINTVLSGLINAVQNEMTEIWPVLKPVIWLGGKLEEELIAFSIDIARDAAWQEALKYDSLQNTEERNTLIVARDQDVARFGSKLYHPGFVLSSLITILRFFETGSIRKKIESLNH